MKCACPHCLGRIEFSFADRERTTPCPHCGQEITLVPATIIGRIAGWFDWQRLGAILGGAAAVTLLVVVLHQPRWKRIDQDQLDAEMRERTIQAGRVIDGVPVNQYWLTRWEIKEYLAILRLELQGLEQHKPGLYKKAQARRVKLIDSLLAPADKFAYDLPHSLRMKSELLYRQEMKDSGLR